MKDILSKLQSRIDKQSEVIFRVGAFCLELEKDQKLDKQLMAEIISLRRQLKQMNEVVDRLLRSE